MKSFFAFIFLAFFYTVLLGQELEIDSFVVVAIGPTYSLNGPVGNIGDYKRGASYILKAFIYPGDYLDNNCPDTYNCGIVLDTIGYEPNGSPIVNAIAQDSTIVIGDWDCRGFFTLDYSEVNDSGGTFDNNIQTFRFYDKPGSPCAGCIFTTEGGATFTALSGTDENIWFDRTIVGGTGPFKFIRGDMSVLAYAHNAEHNASGCCNSKYVVKYQIVDSPLQYGKQLDVSVNGLSLIWDEPNNTANSYGATLVLEGVIYPDGTFSSNGPTSGMDANGNLQFTPIGKWTCRGWWFSEDKDYNPSEGLFSISQQTFDYEDPILGQVQIVTEGKDFVALNESVEKIVVGATDALKGHRGNCTETLVGINSSNGFNFTYDFDTKVLVGTTEEVEKVNSITLSLYPNPARNLINVAVDQLEEQRNYSIQIIDITSKLLYDQSFISGSEKFNLDLNIAAYPQGLYTLILKREGIVLGSKGFVKMK